MSRAPALGAATEGRVAIQMMKEFRVSNRSRGKNTGFTLPEVLVTVSLIAVLAAVVIPAVAGKVSAGPPNATEQSSTAMRGALEAYISDVTKAPIRPSYLFRPITTSDSAIDSTTYNSFYTNRWKGPYVQRDSVSTFAANNFGPGTLKNQFRILTANGSKYLALVASGFSLSVLKQIKLDIDNDTVSADSAMGLVQYKKDTLLYLLYPKP